MRISEEDVYYRIDSMNCVKDGVSEISFSFLLIDVVGGV